MDTASLFDFIIVGGSDASLVLARRLAEGVPGASIALIEPGWREGLPRRQRWPWTRPARPPALWSVPQPGLNGRVLPLVDESMQTASLPWGGDPADARIDPWPGWRGARLRFDGKRCTGVEVLGGGGRTRRMSARREVLLCAGALVNAQLLQVSGVGDGAALQKAGIRFKHHLPGVGRNLRDRLGFVLQHEARVDLEPQALVACEPLPSLPGVQWQLDVSLDGPRRISRLGRRMRKVSLGFTLSDPASRGELKSQGPDVREAPRIDPRYFDDPDDVQRMWDALRVGRQWLTSVASRWPLGHERVPGGAAGELLEREALRDQACGLGHFAGTCQMGDGGGAVVDGQMRVHGLQGVRVADASVQPDLDARGAKDASVAWAEICASEVLASMR